MVQVAVQPVPKPASSSRHQILLQLLQAPRLREVPRLQVTAQRREQIVRLLQRHLVQLLVLYLQLPMPAALYSQPCWLHLSSLSQEFVTKCVSVKIGTFIQKLIKLRVFYKEVLGNRR